MRFHFERPRGRSATSTSRKVGYQWQTTVFAYRRRALRKVELEALLRAAGFQHVRFLPQDSPWDPYQVVADSSR
jgi:hypothetical protein